MPIWSFYSDTVSATWHLGFTAFGGPAVQFQTFHIKFVTDLAWIDESTYQQIFSLSNALPGSAATKMLFCINAIHNGFLAGFIAFALFCLPGALGMYILSLCISHLPPTLPTAVYALLSGLNAATVGIITLAAVRLSERAVVDQLTRFLVCLAGGMGLLYSAIWYYPVLMLGAGVVGLVGERGWMNDCIEVLKRRFGRDGRKLGDGERRWRWSWSCWRRTTGCRMEYDALPLYAIAAPDSSGKKLDTAADPTPPEHTLPEPTTLIPQPAPDPDPLSHPNQPHSPPSLPAAFPSIPRPLSTTLLLLFLATLILSLTIPTPSLPFTLFTSFYQAGTLIFGGGPVLIPLLREYTITPGWVTPRDFLLGCALIQAFPGPNFNMAIFLGALAARSAGIAGYVGAGIAFAAVYTPGLILLVGVMGFWRGLSARRWFLGCLRGVNAAAVGLVFSAVFRLWQMGFLSLERGGEGGPLGGDPWLVAIMGAAFVGGKWFGVAPPVAILAGGLLGVGKWVVVVQ